jgi:cell wall-associated NlpC family hydrolase
MFLKNKYIIVLILFNLLMPLQAKSSESKSYLSIYIEAIAKSMLGKRYKWGGEGPYNYDCSGFTKEVFEENGIELPRNSWNQAKVGKKVKRRNQLKKGDLVFFTSKNHTKINHVGIYLGHGKFIHASRFHHRIVISPLREYKKYFKWGTRLT